MSGLLAVGYFLFALFFSLISFVLWTRIALRYCRISALHPISRSINALTDPLIMPLTHQLTASKTRASRYDWPCFSVLVLVVFLKYLAIGSLFIGGMLPWSFLPLYTLADLIVEPCNLLTYAIIIRVLMSWLNPGWQNPIADVIRQVTNPLLHWASQWLPQTAGFDFSPVVILVLLKVITLFINASLPLHLM